MPNEAILRELDGQERQRLIDRLIDELPVLRTKLGLSQDELASVLDISRQTYSSIETKRRKMSWSIYLALILLLDNNDQTHDFLRKSGLFPGIVFQNSATLETDPIFASFGKLAGEDVRDRLDEKAIHAIETVIMVEYARCNNMSSEAVIKAFEGRRLSLETGNAVKAKRAIKAIKAKADED